MRRAGIRSTDTPGLQGGQKALQHQHTQRRGVHQLQALGGPLLAQILAPRALAAQAQAFGPEQRLGPPGGEATHSPGPEPRSQALEPEPGCAWPSVQSPEGAAGSQSLIERFRMPPGCPWMQARSGGASVQRGSPRWQPASRCRSVRASTVGLGKGC